MTGYVVDHLLIGPRGRGPLAPVPLPEGTTVVRWEPEVGLHFKGGDLTVTDGRAAIERPDRPSTVASLAASRRIAFRLRSPSLRGFLVCVSLIALDKVARTVVL